MTRFHLVPQAILAVALACGLVAGNATAADAPAQPAAAAAPAKPGAIATVDVNTATDEQLRTLPKVGPALAKRILDYRKQVGTIKTVDELRNVQGIGDKTLEILRPYVTVGGAAAKPKA